MYIKVNIIHRAVCGFNKIYIFMKGLVELCNKCSIPYILDNIDTLVVKETRKALKQYLSDIKNGSKLFISFRKFDTSKNVRNAFY